jgi:conjugal transfer pilus assembly protein TraE
MNLEQKQSELRHEKRIKEFLIGLSVLLVFLVLVQAISMWVLINYAHTKHEVHFLPPKITQEFSLSNTGVSEAYLWDMTYFLTQLRFNVTPTSAVYQFKSLLGYVDSSLHGEMHAQLVKEIEQIKHEHLSTVFYPEDKDVDMKNLIVRVSGQMKRLVGAELMSDKRETYEIQFSYDQGLLKIINLKQVSK